MVAAPITKSHALAIALACAPDRPRRLPGLGGAVAWEACTAIPECNDGLDNDGDGLIDDVDPACAASDPRVRRSAGGVQRQHRQRRRRLTDFPDDPGRTAATDTDEFNERMPECMDELDNDGDGKIDHPNDPGCFVANQDSELDDCPDGPGCPECGDGDDNDADGQIDYPADTACAAALGAAEFMFDANACGAGTVIENLPSNGQVAGTIPSGTSNVASVSCNAAAPSAPTCSPSITRSPWWPRPTRAAPCQHRALRAPHCLQATSEVACHDDISGTNNHSRSPSISPREHYYLVVDGRDMTSTGNFQLSVIFYEGLGGMCDGPGRTARPGYTCRPVPPATETTRGAAGAATAVTTTATARPTSCSTPAAPALPTPTRPTRARAPAAGLGGDGVDNDLDGATDYPMDTSCTSASALSEADCPIETDALIRSSAR